MRRSLDSWIKHLDGVRLPVPAASHEKVRRALGDSRRSLRDIAELTQDSPALALSLLREANAAGNLLSSPAESLEIALSRLGLKRAETLLNRLPAVPAACGVERGGGPGKAGSLSRRGLLGSPSTGVR